MLLRNNRFNFKPIRLIVIVTFASICIILLLRSFQKQGHRQTLPTLSPNRQSSEIRIGKASVLFETQNELLERALASHEQHNEIHGYPIQVSRRQVTDGYLNERLLHLQTILTQELAKEAGDRLHWIWYTDPNLVLVNPGISLDVYLPPSEPEYTQVSLLVSRKNGVLTTSSFFIRVCPESLELVIKSLSIPAPSKSPATYDTSTTATSDLESSSLALATLLNTTAYESLVLYQPSSFYAEEMPPSLTFPGSISSLAIIFPPTLPASAIAQSIPDTLATIASHKAAGRLPYPFEQSQYPRALHEYWWRLREARERIGEAESILAGPDSKNEDTKGRVQELVKVVERTKNVLAREMDDEDKMKEGIERIKWHLKLLAIERADAGRSKNGRQGRV